MVHEAKLARTRPNSKAAKYGEHDRNYNIKKNYVFGSISNLIFGELNRVFYM